MANPPLLFVAAALLLPTLVFSHGLMTDPPQRGTLNPKNKFNDNGVNETAPIDNKAHFPAGDKDAAPGAGVRSQIAAVPYWTPFRPMEPDFKWRAGVCGDQIGKPQTHMRGGFYYFGGQITRTYTSGAIIEVEINIIAHHNGFVELHVCDIAKCGGEVSEKCFKEGHCHHLRRAANEDCDSGYDKRCAPIDPSYPHRWYLPCTTVQENTQERFGGEKMKYKLPDDLHCEHCVMHWFWSAANICNPPGVIEFYQGPHGPKNWGQCFGQGGARGGYTKVQKDCGPDRFPEEYYTCADVRILPGTDSKSEKSPSSDPANAKPSDYEKPLEEGWTEASFDEFDGTEPMTTSSGPSAESPLDSVITEFSLVADGKIIRSLQNSTVVDIGKYRQVAIEAVTTKEVSKVLFFIDSEIVWTDWKRPYFMFGNVARVPNYWKEPIVNRFFELRASADGHELQSKMMFLKRE